MEEIGLYYALSFLYLLGCLSNWAILQNLIGYGSYSNPKKIPIKYRCLVLLGPIPMVIILTFGIPMLMIYLAINGGLWLIGKEDKLDEWWSKFKTYVS